MTTERGYVSESSNARFWKGAVQELKMGKVLSINFMKLQVLWDVSLRRWNGDFIRFETSQARISWKLDSVTEILYLGVSISIRTFHIYWTSLVEFGIGDCQIILLSSLIVSFNKIGTQKNEVHAWVYMKSCHIYFFYIFVTIRITFPYGRCLQTFLEFNEFCQIGAVKSILWLGA